MKIFFAIFCSIFTGVVAYAQGIPRLQFNISSGYARQDFKWSIAGNSNGQNPNVYSELQWKDLGGIVTSLSGQWNFAGRFMLMGSYANANITTGKVTDNDYNGDNRTQMVYKELFDADEGHSRDWNAGFGFQLINTSKFSLAPYAGYSVSSQSLHLLDRSGQFSDLNSTYHADWKGPFFKVIATMSFASKFKLSGEATYNQANYQAKADWNLISIFQHPISYTHTAKGYGVEAALGLSYAIAKHVAVKVETEYFTWQTGKGIDELYLSSGGSEKTQLNGVDRAGYRLTGGATFIF